ncbi:MAG: serine hydrolase [Thermomicrobiales bacterium]
MTLATAIDRIMRAGIDDGVFPGGVVLVCCHGEVVLHRAYGHALLHADAQTRVAHPIPTALDTVYDLASVTKVFTATGVMNLVEAGCLRLDDTVATHLPAFAANGKETITVRQLLTHTAGLPYVRLWEVAGSPDDRIAHALAVTPEAPPGTTSTYHDTNFIVLGRLIEEVTGRRLDRALGERVLDPLALTRTGFRVCLPTSVMLSPRAKHPRAKRTALTMGPASPGDASIPQHDDVQTRTVPSATRRHTIAATEDAAHVGRGMVRGEVHDENAWALGGVAGHAGLFGTAGNLGIFGQVFLDHGCSDPGLSDSVRLVSAAAVAEMTRNQIGALGGRGLGWQLDEPSHMGRLASPETFGHTGFTGTSLVIDPHRRVVMVMLTNRVHPTRTGPDVYAIRRAVADAIADAINHRAYKEHEC